MLAAGTQAFIAGEPAMAILPLALAAIFTWNASERRATLIEPRDSLARDESIGKTGERGAGPPEPGQP
ncbi:hypothetical protein ABZV91_05465, partial [Nocardia sp. NPDC004568]